MKVKELIEYLRDFNPEMEVHTCYGYGDYWHTQVAPKVGYVEEAKVGYSEYHRMDKLIETDAYDDMEFEDEEPGNPEENVTRVLVIG